MNPSPRPKPLIRRLQIRLAQARFLTFSALLHLVIVIMAGSVVLIKNITDPPDFEATEGGLVSTDASVAQPPAEPQTTTPEFTPQTPTASAPNLQALTTNATSATFALNATPTAINLDSKINKLSSAASKGMGEAIDKAMAGASRMGGTGRFFGSREKSALGLTGSFYDLKQTRSRKPTNLTNEQFGAVVTKFVEGGWRESVLNDYFKAPQPLTATELFIPNMAATEAPKAFDVEKEVQPSRWVVHYKGRVSPAKDGTYRFVGAGDDYMVVRFNGKLVMDHGFYKATDWQADQYYNYSWTGVPKGFARGEKIQVRAGQYYDLEVLISERPGGLVFFCLMLEDQNAEYQNDGKGNPILPVFRLADTAVPELQAGQTLPPYERNGPIWKAAAAGNAGGSMLDNFFGPK